MSSQNSAPEPHAPLLHPRHGAARSPTPTLHSMMVREMVARDLEEHRTNWSNSKPLVVLDMTWNMAFVVVSAVMLGCTVNERPNTPIRWWICGYVLQCVVHVGLVWLEYRRRNERPKDEESGGGNHEEDGDVNESEDDDVGVRSSGNSSCFRKQSTFASFQWASMDLQNDVHR